MPSMLTGHNSCCGIYLLSSFSCEPEAFTMARIYNPFTGKGEDKRETYEAQFMRHMEQVKANCSPTTRKGKLVEVVVTDTQMNAFPNWAKILKREGFKLVGRFDNSSGTVCNVLHWCHQPMDDIPEWYSNEPEPTTMMQRAVKRVAAAAKGA